MKKPSMIFGKPFITLNMNKQNRGVTKMIETGNGVFQRKLAREKGER